MTAVLIGLTGVTSIAASSASAAGSTSTGTGISYTLEGCRASTDAYLAGTFVCPDSAYTTGNLGPGWNEFDLVPGRVILDASNSHPAGEIFSFVVAVDYCSGTATLATCNGTPGYDRLSVPVLNTRLSNGNCGTIVVSDPAVNSSSTGSSLYRTVTVTGQDPNATCVYDFYGRLAFNSHLYPGSSLHYNLLNSALTTANIGARDVSIPVKGILAPGFTKTQRSTQGSSVVWTVQKRSTPTTVSFPQTCPATAVPQTSGVTVTVSWSKVTTSAGAVTVTATIQLTNNAHRSIDVGLSDQLFTGSTAAAGNEILSPDVNTFTLTPSDSETITDVFTVTGSSATSFSDIVTATFTDPVFHDVIATTTRTASSDVETLAPTSGATAVISDVERLTDASDVQLTSSSPYRFSVDSRTGVAGTFSDYPVLGAQTVGPVTWSSGTVSDSGSTTFNKTVYVNSPTTDTAKLADTATVTPDSQTATSASASSTITSGATVSLTITKTIPVVLGSGDSSETFTFPVTGPGGYSSSPTITFGTGDGGSLNPKSTTLTGLAPGTYTVAETTLAPYAPQSSQDVTLTLPTCSGTAPFTNRFGPASAQVRKVTVPAGSEAGWVMTLTGPGTPAGGESVTTTGTGYVPFTTQLQEGSYTITETAQSGWDQTGASSECSFSVNYPADADRVFSCTFTNTQQGHVTVLKTENGGVPTHAYTFTLAGGPSPGVSLTRTTSAGNAGALDFGLLKPGTYTLCELAVPAATHSTLQDQGGTVNATTGDVCLTFTLAAGETRAFTIDNQTPGGGQRTIGYWKNWNSCSTTGNNRVAMAAKTGNHLMDEFLPQPLGNYTVDTCAKGLAVLQAASGKYAENQLAAQLLAAELNVAAGASTCQSVTDAIQQANALLVTIGYNGPPSAKIGSNSQYRQQALSLANLLDRYNNGLIC